jgi:serine/threonine protein kinase
LESFLAKALNVSYNFLYVKAREFGGGQMELSKEYMLSQYQELGILNGNNSVRLVRHSITGRIAVKKCMKIEQKPVYEFLMVHKNKYIPQIYGYFENGDQMIVIEEYIEGRNLEDILCEQRMPVEEGSVS